MFLLRMVAVKNSKKRSAVFLGSARTMPATFAGRLGDAEDIDVDDCSAHDSAPHNDFDAVGHSIRLDAPLGQMVPHTRMVTRSLIEIPDGCTTRT